MKVVRHETTPTGGVILYLDRSTGLHAHFIMPGLAEERRVAWDLPDDVDPLNVLFAEIDTDNSDDPLPAATEGDYAAGRARIIAAAKAQQGKMVWPSAKVKADVQKACEVGEEHRQAIEHFVRSSMQERGIQHIDQKTSLARARGVELEYAAGRARMDQERLADEIISGLPEHIRHAPRTVDEDGSPVELSIRFTP